MQIDCPKCRDDEDGESCEYCGGEGKIEIDESSAGNLFEACYYLLEDYNALRRVLQRPGTEASKQAVVSLNAARKG